MQSSIPAPNAFSSFSILSEDSEDFALLESANGPREITFPDFFTLPSTGETISRLPFSSVVCPITGIVLLIGIPELPFALSYGNPLAKPRNAFRLSQTPTPTLKSLDNNVLAGSILSLLSGSGLLVSSQDLDSVAKQREAASDNATLSTVYTKEALIEILQATAKIWENQRSVLFRGIPSFSSGNVSEIRDFVKDAITILFPESEARKEKPAVPLKQDTKIPVRRLAQPKPITFNIHVRLQIKNGAAKALAEKKISAKAFSLLEKHCDTSERISSGQRSALLSYLLPISQELAELVAKMPVSVSEEIIDEISAAELIDETEEKPKKTARQMLEEWKAAKAAKAAKAGK